jgi:transposase
MAIRARIKTQKNKNGTTRSYLCLVESYWDKEKKGGREREIANLGRIDLADNQDLADKIIQALEKHTVRNEIIASIEDIEPESAKYFGSIQIFRTLWNKLGFEKILREYICKSNFETDFVETIFMMVCNKLMNPKSERATDIWKDDVYEPLWDKFQLHHLYRALDFLIEHKKNIEIDLFNSVRNLFNLKVDVVMFDTTSISYWGEGHRAPDLLKYGVAKNKRNDLKQVIVGIIMDQTGIPLGHEVWQGNKSDKPAFKEIIEKVKTRYSINKVILVADRGMISEDNIAFLEENKYEYVLGVKMRQLPKTRQHILLENSKEFKHIKVSEDSKNSGLMYKEMLESTLWEMEQTKIRPDTDFSELAKEYSKTDKGKRRWIVCLNPQIEAIDSKKREYFRQILENKIEFSAAKDWIINNGYKKYINIKDMTIELNEERLREDELYDGKWIMISNSSLDVSELITTYKNLNAIERHFRDLKSELEVGPVYHHKERRIRAHIFLSFIALQIKTGITRMLKSEIRDVSYSEAMNDVSKIKAVTFNVGNRTIVMRTKFEGLANFVYSATGTKIPNKMLYEESLT